MGYASELKPNSTCIVVSNSDVWGCSVFVVLFLKWFLSMTVMTCSETNLESNTAKTLHPQTSELQSSTGGIFFPLNESSEFSCCHFLNCVKQFNLCLCLLYYILPCNDLTIKKSQKFIIVEMKEKGFPNNIF